MPAPVDIVLLRKAIRVGTAARVTRLLTKLEPAALAELLEQLSPAEVKAAFQHLLDAQARLAPIFSVIPRDLLPELLERLDDGLLARLLERLDPDDAVSLFHSIDEERQAPVLERTAPQRAALVQRLLTYSPESAGRRMIPRFVAVPQHATVGEAIRAIRRADRDVPVFYLYVVDDEERLVGVVSLSQLVKSGDETPVREVHTTDLVSVGPEADQEQVARLVSRRHLLAVPVVGDRGQLLGLVTIDDVLGVLEQEATEDMYRMTGLSEGDRVFSPPHRSLIKRLPWNALNLLTSLCAAMVVAAFEDTISKLVALATFMPVVAGIGGNTGNQSLTVIIRGITLGELEFSSGLRALAKEVTVGVSIGVVIGSLVGVVAYLWKGNLMLGVVIAMAMVANLFVGALAATAIPLTLKRLGLDPALGSTILVTMCTDVFGFLSFLGLATLFMSMLL